MRKFILGFQFIALLFCQISIAQSDSSLVNGKVENYSNQEIQLNYLTTRTNQDGVFSFRVAPEINSLQQLKVGNISIDLYLEKKDSLSVSLNYEDPAATIEFDGDHKNINTFLFEQKETWQQFNSYFNYNINRYLAKLPEHEYVRKMDSLKLTILNPLKKLEQKHPGPESDFFNFYRKDINLYFTSFIADYPFLHYKTTGEEVELSSGSKASIDSVDLTNYALYTFEGFKRLIKNYLYMAIKQERKKAKYNSSDNQYLEAGFEVIDNKFKSTKLFEPVLYEFFLNHIENLGVKNIEDQYEYFMNVSSDSIHKANIRKVYEYDLNKRANHLIVPYKSFENYNLDAHVFKPQILEKGKAYPVVIMFHGGSFFEGKPDWFFITAQKYVDQGWVAVAAEYRLADRHANDLAEAISDGKSLVRFMRLNSKKFQIDPQKILVMGNSSGATISLALASVGNILDEKNENLQVSSKPNAAIIYAGLADLKEAGYWWQEGYSKNFIEKISPINNAKKELPPILLFHGTKDNSVDIKSIRAFVDESKNVQENNVKLIELQGAPHMIWRIPYFSKQMEAPKEAFLKSLNWSTDE